MAAARTARALRSRPSTFSWACGAKDVAAPVRVVAEMAASGQWTTLTLPAAMAGAIQIVEIEHVISAGGAQTTSGQIPQRSVVLGVTARVKEEITGVSGWSLGINEAETRYGSGLSTGVGAQVRSGLTAPMAHANNAPLKLSPEGGSFTGGRVTLHVYRVELTAPPA